MVKSVERKRGKKINVLVCSHEYPPHGSGIAYLVEGASRELRKMGYNIDLCTPHAGTYSAGSVSCIDRLGGIGILHYWFQAAKILRSVGSSYDLIWVHNPLFFRKINQKRVCASVHTTYREYTTTLHLERVGRVQQLYQHVMILLERMSYKKQRGFFYTVTSDKTRSELRALGIHQSFPLVNNGFEPQHFFKASLQEKRRLRERLGLPLGRRVLIHAGRFSPQKRQELMMRRFSQLCPTTSQKLTLVVIGSGALRKRLESVRDELCTLHPGLDIRLVNQVSHKRLAQYYRASDFVIMPSLYEGQPLALIEAMATGLIPLLSPIPIFKRLVAETQVGICIDFDKKRSVQRLKQEIELPRYSSRSSTLATYMNKHHSWNSIAKVYGGVFSSLIGKESTR